MSLSPLKSTLTPTLVHDGTTTSTTTATTSTLLLALTFLATEYLSYQLTVLLLDYIADHTKGWTPYVTLLVALMLAHAVLVVCMWKMRVWWADERLRVVVVLTTALGLGAAFAADSLGLPTIILGNINALWFLLDMLLIVITTLYVVIYVVFVDGGDVSGVNAYLRDVRVVEGKRRVIGGGVVWSHSHGYAGETTEKSPLVVPLTEVVVIERSVCMSE